MDRPAPCSFWDRRRIGSAVVLLLGAIVYSVMAGQAKANFDLTPLTLGLIAAAAGLVGARGRPLSLYLTYDMSAVGRWADVGGRARGLGGLGAVLVQPGAQGHRPRSSNTSFSTEGRLDMIPSTPRSSRLPIWSGSSIVHTCTTTPRR